MSAQQKKHPFDFKTQYGLGLNPQDDEIVVDFFCGGAGTGLEIGLGRAVGVAKNHSPQAISMHTMNHPGAQHFTTDVFEGGPDTECGGKAFHILERAVGKARGFRWMHKEAVNLAELLERRLSIATP